MLPRLHNPTDLNRGATFFRPEIGTHLCHFRYLQCLHIGLPANGTPWRSAVWEKIIGYNDVGLQGV